MEELKIRLHKKGADKLLRTVNGDWFLENKEITQEEAIMNLANAFQDLGHWCQTAKDVLPREDFEMVQEAYEYHEE